MVETLRNNPFFIYIYLYPIGYSCTGRTFKQHTTSTGIYVTIFNKGDPESVVILARGYRFISNNEVSLMTI